MASIYEAKTTNGTYYYLREWINGKVVKTYLGTKPPIRRSRGWTNLPQDTIDWIKRQRQTPSNIKQTLTLPTNGKYRTIVVDPPWPIEEIQLRARSNEHITPYAMLPLPTIKKGAGPIPIKRLAEKNGCHIFLWTTQKYLNVGFEILQSWGFRHIFTMVWHKNAGMQPFNLPQYNCEFVLFGRKGSLSFVDTKNFQTCFYSLRREHSRKPDEFYELVKRVSHVMALTNMATRPVSTTMPQETRVDFIHNGTKNQANGLVSARLVQHGNWKIDKKKGKTLCLVEITIPKLGIKVNFTPSEGFEDELLQSWLDAERANDNFVFDQPIIGPQRPSQLQKKAQHIHKVIENYVRNNGGHNG